MKTLDFNVMTRIAYHALIGILAMMFLLLDLMRLNTNHRLLPHLQ